MIGKVFTASKEVKTKNESCSQSYLQWETL